VRQGPAGGLTCSHSSCLSAHSRLGSQISVQQMKRETSSTFHCMVHGDLFELAEPEWIAQNDPQPQAAKRMLQPQTIPSISIIFPRRPRGWYTGKLMSLTVR
jgi:hypothetical protein